MFLSEGSPFWLLIPLAMSAAPFILLMVACFCYMLFFKKKKISILDLLILITFLAFGFAGTFYAAAYLQL